MEKEFTSCILPESKINASIIEGKGLHYFKALEQANGNGGMLVKLLILQLVRIENKPISEQFLIDLHIRDVIRLTDIINLMMSEL